LAVVGSLEEVGKAEGKRGGKDTSLTTKLPMAGARILEYNDRYRHCIPRYYLKLP
jgi:hypothetical protein